jgi:hypothetical protein
MVKNTSGTGLTLLGVFFCVQGEDHRFYVPSHNHKQV